MATKMPTHWVVTLFVILVFLFLINILRFLSDASYGTSARINLSDWVDRLGEIRPDDIYAAGIYQGDLPTTISVAQLQAIYKNRSSAQDIIALKSMPHLEDPWGALLKFELLSISPIHWRVTSRVGRTFFGIWVFGISEIPWKGSMIYKTGQFVPLRQ